MFRSITRLLRCRRWTTCRSGSGPASGLPLIGRVGSGKSTLQKLILGLFRPTGGSIRVDGIDTNQIDPAELRRNIGYVPQDVVLFYGSLRDNIAMGSPMSTMPVSRRQRARPA